MALVAANADLIIACRITPGVGEETEQSATAFVTSLGLEVG